MTEPDPNRPYARDPVEKESDTRAIEDRLRRESAADDRGGFGDTAPNPHDREGSMRTAGQAAGWMTGMMLPAVILAIVAIVIILYFVLR